MIVEPKGVALVTGASRGIGRAVALELSRVGFDVVAGMRQPDEQVFAGEGTKSGGTLEVRHLDVIDPDSISIPEGLRVLVNNAGIETEYLPVEHAPIEDWRSVFETNLFGLVDVTRQAIPELRKRGGVICNITSSSILVPVPFYAVYRASKAAVASLSETLASELKPFGIRILEILPGPVATDMLANSDRLPEGAAYPGYETLAHEMLEGRRSVERMITQTRDAARAIVDAILDDGSGLRNACDDLGRGLLEAWTSDPLQFLST